MENNGKTTKEDDIMERRKQEMPNEQKPPTRYWKPNMAALPPRLGRRIIKYIMTPRKFDYSQLDAECDFLEQELAKIGRDDNGSKYNNAGK